MKLFSLLIKRNYINKDIINIISDSKKELFIASIFINYKFFYYFIN